MSATHEVTLPEWLRAYDDPAPEDVGTDPLEPVVLDAADAPHGLGYEPNWRGVAALADDRELASA